MFEIYIKPDNNIIKYIVEIQKFDKMKSIGEIRNAILNGTPVLTYDLYSSDLMYIEFTQGLSDHEQHLLFYDLVKRLIDMGADVIIKDKTAREDGEVISLQLLANSIESSRIIAEQQDEERRLMFMEEDEEDDEEY